MKILKSCLFVMMLVAPFTVGCGSDPCVTLSGRCSKCAAIQQPGCQAVVTAGDTKACQDTLKLFDQTQQCK